MRRILIMMVPLAFGVLAACGSDSANVDAFEVTPAETASTELTCEQASAGRKSLLWGDLHVHTALSLDAYGFGTFAGPAEAYRFAAGGAMELGERTVQLDRPLDFAAVTDHAEWLDMLHICSEPTRLDHPFCNSLRAKASRDTGIQVMQEFMLPTIAGETPAQSPICVEDPERCDMAAADQWSLMQEVANAADRPCEFTAMIGYEWSATPGNSHSHRNLIFKNENVTRQALDYIRYPNLADLFEQLDAQCLPEEECDVIAIPHNTNMGDGVGFDIETDTDRLVQLRGRYERLIEIHQEKGNSECLPPFGEDASGDCDFEVWLSSRSRPKAREAFSEAEWEKMRSTYVRSLLLRGLAAYTEDSSGHDHGAGSAHDHPLRLGIVASTDSHTATPGAVSEEDFQGTAFSFGSFERAMATNFWNPGGITGVWAEENTRESIFEALKRRETYGTSGPRIEVQFGANATGEPLACDGGSTEVLMGGEFIATSARPSFRIEVKADRTPLDTIEIIKGSVRNGELIETRELVWMDIEGDGNSACVIWNDPDFDASAPSFWYPRILEQPTKRWSQFQCEAAGRCDEFPQAVQDIQERAWGSPIWYLPE